MSNGIAVLDRCLGDVVLRIQFSCHLGCNIPQYALGSCREAGLEHSARASSALVLLPSEFQSHLPIPFHPHADFATAGVNGLRWAFSAYGEAHPPDVVLFNMGLWWVFELFFGPFFGLFWTAFASFQHTWAFNMLVLCFLFVWLCLTAADACCGLTIVSVGQTTWASGGLALF